MTVAEVKETLQGAGVNLNDAQFEAIHSLLGSGGGGSSIDITEINETNLQQAIEATSNIVCKIGLDVQDREDENQYAFFYSRIGGKLIELPVIYLQAFVNAGIPAIKVDDFVVMEADISDEPIH